MDCKWFAGDFQPVNHNIHIMKSIRGLFFFFANLLV